MQIKYKNFIYDYTKPETAMSDIKKLYPLYQLQFFNEFLKIPEFKQYFFSIYESYDDYRKNKNFCRNCNQKTQNKVYCSECYKLPEIQEEITKKVKKTKFERYGNENYCNIEKQKETIKKTYNVENVSQIPSVSEKIRESKANQNVLKSNEKRIKTNLKKYGKEFATQSSDVKSKTRETNLEKYGKEFSSQTDSFKESVKQTWKGKSKDEIDAITARRAKTNLERYGKEFATQLDSFKESVRQTWKEKSKDEIDAMTVKRVKTNREKYGPEYASQSHIKNIEKLNRDYCSETFLSDDGFFELDKFMDFFNTSYSAAMDYKQRFNILNPNKIKSLKTQKFIFNSINTENKIFNAKNIVENLELDIYLPDVNLAIEFNGLMYHSQGLSSHEKFNTPNYPKNYHLNKLKLCESKGIKLLHIFEGEDLDLWLSMINNRLGTNSKIYARQTTIKEVSNQEIKEFLSLNHLQGYASTRINLGLYYGDNLVSVMTFSKPRFNHKYDYELIRFCSLRNTTVVGGASKLFKFFINQYKPESIISYANRRFSQGNIYEKLGFSLLGESEPNYFYFKPGKVFLESRNKYQRHKLENMFENGILHYYNASESEKINMLKNGYRRIYDCGNLVFEWRSN